MSLRPGPSCSVTTEVVFLWMLCMCVGDQFYSGKLSAFVAVTLLVGFYHHRPPPPQLFSVIFKTCSKNLSPLKSPR